MSDYFPAAHYVEYIAPADEWRAEVEEFGPQIQATTYGCSCCSSTHVIPRNTDDLLNVLNAKLSSAEQLAEHYRNLLQAFERGGYDAVLAELQV